MSKAKGQSEGGKSLDAVALKVIVVLKLSLGGSLRESVGCRLN